MNWDFVQIVVATFLMTGGVFFVIAGAVGVVRLPDFYTRMHAAGITDTLGAECILLGLIVQSGLSQTSLKLALIAFLLFITSPTASHAVANAAHHAGLRPLLGAFRAPHPQERQAALDKKNADAAKSEVL